MIHKDFEEESKYLDNTIHGIHGEIDRTTEKLNQLYETGKKLSYDDKKRGEHFNVNSRIEMATDYIKKMQRSLSVPYFGRMDVSFSPDNGTIKKLYIGRSGIIAAGVTLVTDWRAPISSLYYDSDIGDVTYEAPEGIIDSKMHLKRQITIKDGKLVDIQDSSFGTNDELLRPYLSVNADNKMKTIIASIQKEQNSIIRKEANQDIIIQGVAGSGKTSVALHRIAYLIYLLNEKIKSEDFLVIGPNDYFLNYISSILPDLDTSPVNQQTFATFVKNYVDEKFSVLSEISTSSKDYTPEYEAVSGFKTSLEYKDMLEKFMHHYINNRLIEDDFEVMGEVIFTKEQLMKFTSSNSKDSFDYSRIQLFIENTLKNDYEKIYDAIKFKYKKVYSQMDFDDPRRREMLDHCHKLYNELKNNSKKLAKNYVKNLNKGTLDIYMKFISSLDGDDLPLTEKESLLLQNDTVEGLQKGKVGFSDLPALLYIKYFITGKVNRYKQIIVDEAQDYGLFAFEMLKLINPVSTFAIYGDLAQAIYPYRSVSSWDRVNDLVFDGECEVLNLSKSYRTTIEITNNANSILKRLGLSEANPVIRHGENVEFYDKANDGKFKLNKINELLAAGFNTMAVICKTDQEAKKVHTQLSHNGLDIRYITDKDCEYSGGVFVLTSADAKGLEFDAVIINDASSKNYNSESAVDMHLLYVACTRSLHELTILYDKQIVPVFDITEPVKKDNTLDAKPKQITLK